MSTLTDLSDNIKKEADLLVSESGLVKDLSNFGKVYFTGAYAGNVMMHGDIDISVVRETPYSAEETLEILRALYLKGKFRSYFIKGDWDDKRKGAEFPHGHYIGMKQKLNGNKWKVDVWFISAKEFEERKKNMLDIASVHLTDDERELILQFKKYRKDNSVDISGQEIYEAVLKKGIKNIEEFMNLNHQK